jgi:ATP-dependent Clp protease ATP-binding subunit ClpA
LELTGAAKERLLEEGYDADFGARPMKRVFQKRIQDRLAIELLQGRIQGTPDQPGRVTVDFDKKREEFVIS